MLEKKESYHLKTLPAHEITPPSSPLSPSKSMRYTNPVFFNPVTLIQITASGISKSPQMTFLLVRSSLIYFTVHQSATANSNTFNQRYIRSPSHHLQWSLFAEIVNVFKPLVLFAGKLHCECLTGFSMQLYSIIYYSTKMALEEALHHWGNTRESWTPPTFILIYTKHKNNKMKFWTHTRSSFP